ncbi:phage tail protein [Pseudoduganella sp. UC29_106]|uniref:phage tail protein n=1 Tax=Pseudoduganella sp. UC29_106 TaxID=3374553 RepID=UPI003757FE96
MSLLGTVAAAVTFAITENPKFALMAYSIGSGIDAYANQPDRIGPRLDDLRTQMSVYGNPIPFEYGCNRHAGTVIWPSILEAVEHETTESAKGGPEQHNFTYTLSLAVLVCEGPIAGIRRIWANKKLIYDVSVANEGATQDPAVGAIRFYNGTEDQEVDPLIEATDGPSPAYLGYAYVVFEDYDVTELGGRPPQFEFEVVSAGTSDIPDAVTFGDHYGVTGSDAAFNWSMDSNGIWVATTTGHAVFDEDTGQYIIDPGTNRAQFQQYDPLTRQLLWAYNVPIVGGSYEYLIQGAAVCSGGYFFVGRNSAGVDGQNYALGVAVNTSTREVFPMVWECIHNGFNDVFYWPSVPVPVLENNKVYFAGGNGLSSGFSVGFMPRSLESEENPGTYTHYTADFTVTPPRWNAPQSWRQSRGLSSCPAGESFDGVSMTLPDWAYKVTTISNPNAAIVQGYGGYITWVGHGPRVTGFDTTAPSIQHSDTLPSNPAEMPCIAWDEVNQTIWAFVKGPATSNYSRLYSIVNGSSSLIVTDTGFELPAIPGEAQSNDVKGMCLDEATGHLRLLVGGGVGNPAYMMLVDPLAESIVDSFTLSTSVPSARGPMFDVPSERKVIYSSGYDLYDIPYGTPIEPADVLLSDIVTDICLRAGLEESDIDVSQLTDLVKGYIVPRQMTARAALEPLQQAYYFDAVESEGKIRFVKRGSSTVTTIPADDRAAHEPGQDMPASLEVLRAFETELPIQCDVEYPDFDADHQIGNQYDRRLTKDTRHRINLQLAIVMNAVKAKEIARTTLYQAWQNNSFRWTTTRKYSYLEPTDIVSLPTDSATYRARITNRRDQPNGIIEWEGAQEAVEVYSQSGADGVTPPYSPQSVYVADPTLLELLDIPLLRDEDNDAGFYIAMAGQA